MLIGFAYHLSWRAVPGPYDRSNEIGPQIARRALALVFVYRGVQSKQRRSNVCAGDRGKLISAIYYTRKNVAPGCGQGLESFFVGMCVVFHSKLANFCSGSSCRKRQLQLIFEVF